MRMNQDRVRRIGWGAVIAVVLSLFLFCNQLVGVIVDWLWFGEVGQRPVWWTILAARLQLALLFGGTFFVFTFLNVWLARRGTPSLTPRDTDFPLRVQMGRLARAGLSLLLFLGSVAAGLLAGLEASGHWDEYLRFLHPIAFGRVDPVFHQDLSFFVFRFPFLSYLYEWLFLALILVTIATVLVYYFDRAVEVLQGYAHVAPRVRAHLSLLLGLLALVKAWGYRLDAYGLLYSANNSFVGAGYTDLHARLLALNLLGVLAVIVALGFLANAFLKLLWLPAVSFAVLIAASVLIGGIYPGMVQRFNVQPNELVMERPYIQRHLEYTRAAYGLDKVEVSSFGPTTPLTPPNVQRNRPTIQNIRLWDYRPLRDTYRQLQLLKPYYSFPGVDIDRYSIGGQSRQVMLAARELNQNDLPAAARLWVNEWLEYTHGYGFVMNPVNAATPDGAPIFWAGDAPQRTPPDLPVSQPQIYYGDTEGTPVIAPSRTLEFDYPTVAEAAHTRYQGTGGVPIDSYWKRLLFATYFGETNLLLSQSISPESRILFNRRIDERAGKIAPFLAYDADPYLVVAQGKLFWVQDAYTSSDHYPYSEAAGDNGSNIARNIRRWALNSMVPDDGSFNYIRNSVKVVTDAYNGTMAFYVADAADPVIRSYEAAFPSLFRPMSEMPAALRTHIRYPEGLFTVQAGIYRSYHVTDPTVLFQQSDRWEVPMEPQQVSPVPSVPSPDNSFPEALQPQGNSQLPMEPFYVTMRLPEGQGEEFVLMLPFEISRPPSMPAWLCARCDGDEYGHLRAYVFPPGVDGPQQVESYIDQNPDVSAKLSLWGQKGSKVIRGNLLALLLDQSILYVEPIFLSATANNLPRLTQVILVNSGRVVMRSTLGEALQALIGGEAAGTESAAAGPSRGVAPPGAPASAGSVQALVGQANQAFNAATEAQRRGDWAAYGTELRRLQQALAELTQRTGIPKK